MEKTLEVIVKLIAAFLIGLILKVWLGGDMASQADTLQVIIFALALTAIITKFRK